MIQLAAAGVLLSALSAWAAEPPLARPAPRSAAWMENWPAFRGPTGDGVAPPSAQPPAEPVVRWKVPIPDAPGNGSPIVWGDRVYLSAEGHRVLAFGAATGRKLWETRLDGPAGAPVEDDPWAMPIASDETGLAAPTPVTDGERVWAFFGTGVLGCVDAATGQALWAVRLVDRPWNSWGLAASPVLWAGQIIQVVDQEPDEADETPRSFLVALDAATGEVRWRTDRPVASGWATPLLIAEEDRISLVTAANPAAIAYDPDSGRQRWRIDGLHGDVAGSPVGRHWVYIAGDPSGEVLALRPGGEGELPDEAIVWQYDRDLPDVSSPACDGRLFVLAGSAGRVQALDAATGEVRWRRDLAGTFWPSPVIAGDRLVLLSDEGELVMLELASGDELGRCRLDERTTASPALAGETIYIRGTEHLWCLGPAEPQAAP